MATYITSDGGWEQERIANALHQLGVKRWGSGRQLQAHDTVVVQGLTWPPELTATKSLTIIAWLPTYGWTPRQQAAILQVCRQATAIVVPTLAAQAWLVKQGLASAKMTTCPLVGGTVPNDEAPVSHHLHRQLPASLPRLMARARLNQAGGWGALQSTDWLTVPAPVIEFISAGLPLIGTPNSPVAELINQYQIGLITADQQAAPAAVDQVTADQYQQLTARVRHLSALLSQDRLILTAFNQVRYQASVTSIDVTQQHPRFNLHVLDNQATLDYIDRYQPSVARLGDGEITLMAGYDQVFQAADPALRQRLREIAATPSDPHLLVCLSDTFHDLKRLVPDAQGWWIRHQMVATSFYEHLGQLGHTYGNTMVTRPYMDLQDRRQAGEVFRRIKHWWQDRDLLIVEGVYTRSGVGNDLYANARSVHRILGPAKNAWAKYQEIEAAIQHYGAGKLVLVMLGMTATVIAADLADWGQVIDLGHLDPEYEWYRQGAVTRVPIQGKHTAEMNYDQGVPQSIDDPQYQAEVILDLSK